MRADSTDARGAPSHSQGPALGGLAKSADEAIMPSLVVPVAVLTIAVPCDRVFLVVSDNLAGEMRHFD